MKREIEVVGDGEMIVPTELVLLLRNVKCYEGIDKIIDLCRKLPIPTPDQIGYINDHNV
jgi:hypothetical protein